MTESTETCSQEGHLLISNDVYMLGAGVIFVVIFALILMLLTTMGGD